MLYGTGTSNSIRPPTLSSAHTPKRLYQFESSYFPSRCCFRVMLYYLAARTSLLWFHIRIYSSSWFLTQFLFQFSKLLYPMPVITSDSFWVNTWASSGNSVKKMFLVYYFVTDESTGKNWAAKNQLYIRILKWNKFSRVRRICIKYLRDWDIDAFFKLYCFRLN